MRNRMILIAVLVSISGTVSAQAPPDPNSAAIFFIPALPGIDAVDVCRGIVDCRYGTTGNLIDAMRDGSIAGVDALGRPYFYALENTSGCLPQGIMWDLAIYRVTGFGLAEEVGRFAHCSQGEGAQMTTDGANFDIMGGNLFLTINVTICNAATCASNVKFVVRVTGLPSLIDIIPTFDPNNTSALNWIAPVKPEAMAGSDGYDVYKGDLDSVSDFSLAAPVACDIPMGRDPVPGEFLTVKDTEPVPSPGNGRYYLVANRFAGGTRVGREFRMGVLRGRDAFTLSGCP